MELQYHGAHCVTISTKGSVIMCDPKSELTKLSPNTKKVTKFLTTSGTSVDANDEQFVVSGPGEYEFEDCSIAGVAIESAQSAVGDLAATIYKVSNTDAAVVLYGFASTKLSEDQMEKLGMVDILVIPIGGSGVAPDAAGAAAVVRAIEPKVVIPVFYSEDGVSYEVPPASLELFAKELGVEVSEASDKFKVKQLPEQLTVQPLKKV